MTLAGGTRLGPYEIVAPVGKGGMGEVYRARDSKLNRDVAIKILPELFAGDRDRLVRFEREAQVLASLNHPGIAHVYGVVDEPPALVMELVEGEDLSQRIARGPIPPDEAIPIAKQIAEALEAAHERGIIHRDLKPANIKVQDDGAVKVLDFGLAKALGVQGPGATADAMHSPTFTMGATEIGVVLGTAAYMAPEQARGKVVDKRADIWGFGCVLFEMIAGKRPFDGAEVTDALAAIVRDEPAWDRLPAGLPAPVRQLIRRCLEKDPKLRLRDIGEARVALGAPPTDERPAVPAERTRRTSWLAPAAGLVLGVAIGAGLMLAMRQAPATSSMSFTLRQLTELPGAETQPDISPDGRQVLYASAASGNWDIYLLRAGGGRAINLTAGSPAADGQGTFSPDGERIAFRSERDGGGLFVMGATGESVRRLTRRGFDPSWSPDGRSLAYSMEGVSDPYSRAIQAELWTLDIASGKANRLVDRDAVQPAWSPGGTRIAYWANAGGQRDIWTIAAAGGSPVAVTSDAATDWSPEWSPDGRWLYFTSDRGGSMNLWRVPIDEPSGAVRGQPEEVTNGVRPIGYSRFSADGTRMVTMAYQRSYDLTLYRFDPARPETVSGGTTLRSPSLGWCHVSNDGQWLACSSRAGQEDLVLMRADGSETRRLMDDVFKDRSPTWSPDGGSIAFMSTRSGEWEIWAVSPDGSNLRQLTSLHADLGFGIWSPDGTRLVSNASTRQPFGMWFFDAAKTATPTSATFTSTKALRVTPASWSGADVLTGTVTDDSGVVRAAITWDVRTGSSQVIDMPIVGNGNSGSWIPGTARFLTDVREGVALVDPATRQWRVILPVVPPYSHSLSRDGRTLLVEKERLDGDVWLMEFAK